MLPKTLDEEVAKLHLEHIYLSTFIFIILVIDKKFNLSYGLVGKRSAHYNAWVTSCTTKVYKTSFSKKNEFVTTCKSISLNLSFDIFFSAVLIQPSYINLTIEVSNITHNAVLSQSVKNCWS